MTDPFERYEKEIVELKDKIRNKAGCSLVRLGQTGGQLMSASEVVIPSELCDLLSEVARLRDEKSAAEAALKSVNEMLDRMERLALESLGVSGLDGCKVAGRTWWMQESLRLSVNADQRDNVLAAAQKEGIAEEITTVATATLKSRAAGGVLGLLVRFA